MAKKTHYFEFRIEIYGAVIVVSISPDWVKSAKRFVKKYGDKNTIDPALHAPGPATHARTFSLQNGKACMIWFPKLPGVSALSHESFHTTCFILKHSGMKLTGSTEEAYAYLLDYICGEITRRLFK